MTICYLDPEDEITGAVARIRAVQDGEAVLVLPPGSRIATSRINFRLLAREAEQKGLTIVAVSDEPGVRALAISAGLPAYDSIAAAQAGLAEFARQDRRLAERLAKPSDAGEGKGQPHRPSASDEPPVTGSARAPAQDPARQAGQGSRLRDAPERPRGAETQRQPASRRQHQPDDATRVMAVPVAEHLRPPEQPTLRPPPADRPDEHPAERRATRQRRRGWALTPLVVAALLLALLGVGAYGAYMLLPTATVTVRPHVAPVGPVNATVVADPRVAVVDVGEGVIPAQRLELTLTASGEFAATGTRVQTVRATGTVRFNSANTVSEVAVPAGTRVRTANGIAFETTAAVVVPRAVFDTGTPGLVDAPVRAVQAGRRGNVAAETVTRVPDALAEQLIRVTNPEPMTGGDRRETRVVAAEDYDAAVAELIEQLDGRLAQALADPETTPRGLTVYPDSAQIGRATAEPASGAVVGGASESFSVAVSAPASVLAVNELLVEQVIVEQLRALVPPTSELLATTVQVSHSPGELTGATISFSASADGSAHRILDRDALVAEIRGRTVDEAREIIGRYGRAELSIWPDFIDRVPDQPARINLTILPPTENV